jgi:single-stranded DNA-binding protein
LANSIATINLLNVRVVRDAERSFTTNGKAITKFDVAVNQWDSGKKVATTAFIKCVAWDFPEAKEALLNQGAVVNISGAPIAYGEYIDKNGAKVKTTTVTVNSYNMTFDSSCEARQTGQSDGDDGEQAFE